MPPLIPIEEYKRVAEILVENLRWAIIGLMFLTAAPLLLYAQFGLDKHSILYDLCRDIGIAILVAVLIAIAYETYARLHFEIKLMTSVIGTLIAEWSRDDIWDEVKKQLIEKRVIREKLRINIKLYSDERLPNGQMVLALNIRYELHGLRSAPEQILIVHYLDKHLKAKGAELPCFESIAIGGKSYPVIDHVKDGILSESVQVARKGGKPIDVVIGRKSIIYVPGIHYFTMTEITKGIELHMEEIPDELEAFFSIRPHMADMRLEVNPIDEVKFDDVLLLSGQGIEFLFKRKID